MIFCLLRTFLENALKKQNFPFSPLSLHCAYISVGNSVFFFFKLAAPCMFCFLGLPFPFKQKYVITFNQRVQLLCKIHQIVLENFTFLWMQSMTRRKSESSGFLISFFRYITTLCQKKFISYLLDLALQMQQPFADRKTFGL